MKKTILHDLIIDTARAARITQSDCRHVIAKLLEFFKELMAICRDFDQDIFLDIRGFGTFYTRVRKKRPARNPRTGEVVWLKRRRVILWRPARDLRGYLKYLYLAIQAEKIENAKLQAGGGAGGINAGGAGEPPALVGGGGLALPPQEPAAGPARGGAASPRSHRKGNPSRSIQNPESDPSRLHAGENDDKPGHPARSRGRSVAINRKPRKDPP